MVVLDQHLTCQSHQPHVWHRLRPGAVQLLCLRARAPGVRGAYLDTPGPPTASRVFAVQSGRWHLGSLEVSSPPPPSTSPHLAGSEDALSSFPHPQEAEAAESHQSRRVRTELPCCPQAPSCSTEPLYLLSCIVREQRGNMVLLQNRSGPSLLVAFPLRNGAEPHRTWTAAKARPLLGSRLPEASSCQPTLIPSVSSQDYADAPLEKPLKLVLKVGGSEVTELSGSGHDSSYYEDRSDHERERHREKKKKKKKKSEKEKHPDDEERRKRKEEKKRKREKEHCDTEGEADDFDPGRKVEVEPPPDRPVRACRTQPAETESTPIQQLLQHFLRQLQRKDPHGFFAFPVTDAIAPGYSMIIKHPMDFGTMKDKIVANEYKSVTEFKADFKLMCDNAMTYNRPDTVYYKLAKKILHAGFKMMSKQAALLGSEDAAVEEPVPEAVPVQVETAKKSKKPSREVISPTITATPASVDSGGSRPVEAGRLALAQVCVGPSGQACSTCASWSSQCLAAGAAGGVPWSLLGAGRSACCATPRGRMAAHPPQEPGHTALGPDLLATAPSCVFEPEGNACSLTDSTAEEHVLALVEHAADEARDRISRLLPGGKMGYLKKLGDGSLLYSVVNAAEPDADEEETHPVDLSSLSSKLLPGFTTLGFKDERRSKVTFLSSASTALSMQNNSVFGDLKSDETELLYSAYGDETGVQCALSLQEFVKDAGSYSRRMVDDLLDQITGGDHSRVLFQLKQRRNAPPRPPDEVKAGDPLGDSSSVLDFMSVKSYSEASLDVSVLSSLGKVQKELERDGSHLTLDEAAKLLQDLQEAQAERGGSRPSSNLSSLSNASEREPHPPGSPHLSVGEPPDAAHDPYEFLQSPEPAASVKN
ncbi:Bromodomain-containing protein 9 [Sciurus carolinensis]|uniref:Bromodomain-containing protein 9 n=1 Tax=Sciurus carolinensis TaxID=30640 RepID=A0AA41NK78_SCICA|nr:Bromodomain-containing protein 9 [Sciurus carolinensis]